MEKEPQPDSLTDVTVKQYAASEVYSTEPPPAYHRPQSTAVQVARICALTVVAVSIVLGGFILAAAYVQSNASCQEWQQEMMLLQEEQRLQQQTYHAPPQPEALVQEDPSHRQHQETHQSLGDATRDKNIDDNSISQESSESDDDSSDEEERTPIHIKLPLQLDFDELAGALMEKNQRSRMNCIVEKRKAEEVVDHQPKTVRLPFGLNLTTDPRYEHVTGERMAIFCESGDEQRPAPREEETMMVQPIIVPLGGSMGPIQFHGGNLQHAPPQMRPQLPQMRPQMEPISAHTIIMEQLPQSQRPPVPVQHNMSPQSKQMPPQMMPPQMQHPNPLMQHIAQQIVAQHEQEMAAAAASARQQQIMQHQQQQHQQPHEMPQHIMHEISHHQMPEDRVHQISNNGIQDIASRFRTTPEEILSQINRLPNPEQVISVSVTEHDAEEIPNEHMRLVQHPRESAQEMNGRQSFARGLSLPVHIPVPMMQHVPQMQSQDQQTRPHYVQPRSIRSVDSVLHREKRVKRCSCDCAC